MKQSIQGLGLVIALGVASQAATAGLVDFTDGGWQQAPDNTRVFGDLEVTLEAFDESNNETSFTQTPYDGSDSAPLCSELGCETDGIGIGDDEVTYGDGKKTDVERLRVSFSREVDIASLIFLDLFGKNALTADEPAEIAQFQVNGGDGGGFTGTAQDTTGFLEGTIDDADPVSSSDAFNGVLSIDLFADSEKLSSPENTDFALAGIRTADVPEPGTLALLGLGLAGLGTVGRRKKS